MCDCKEFYPQYGPAPHECYWRKPGGFEKNPLGTSTIEPPAEWPDNFLAEIDKSESVEKQISWGLCGVWFCPKCKEGMQAAIDRSNELVTKDELLTLLSAEAAQPITQRVER